MAEAIVNGIIKSDIIKSSNIEISDPHEDRQKLFNSKWNIKTFHDNANVIKNKDYVFLCIKPQNVNNVMNQLPNIFPKNTILLSILAGTTTDQLEQKLKINKIVRCMPNTPAMIGEGMTVWYQRNIDKENIKNIKTILQSFGKEIQVDDEDKLDVVTALSGTGPAYVYYFAESMVDSGVQLGFSRELSQALVYQTIKGSILYAEQSNKHLSILRNEITSPGGTTADAMYQLDKSCTRTAIADAIFTAYHKSKSMH